MVAGLHLGPSVAGVGTISTVTGYRYVFPTGTRRAGRQSLPRAEHFVADGAARASLVHSFSPANTLVAGQWKCDTLAVRGDVPIIR